MAWYAVVDGIEYRLPKQWRDEDVDSLMISFASTPDDRWVPITQTDPDGVAHILMRPNTSIHIVKRSDGTAM